MKYIFFGTPNFAAIILEKLISAGLPPAAVICNPDRPVGREQIITPPPVKLVIRNKKLENDVQILQPEILDVSIFNSLNVSEIAFAVVAAYAKILPKEIIAAPRLGTIGVHPSLLPRYRGATPIQSAILAGEKETGVTLFLIDEKVDHGAVLRNKKLEIRNEDNYQTLMQKLAQLSGDLLIETLPQFIKGEIQPKAQNEDQATYTKKFTGQDGFVNSADLEAAQRADMSKAEVIMRKIRALNPEPSVYTLQNGKRVKLLAAEIKDGLLRLTQIQKEGKKPQQL